MYLGELIKAYREEYNMPQSYFAEKAGISKGYVSMLENNKNPKTGLPIVPTYSIFQKVAAVLGISTDTLIRSMSDDQLIADNASFSDDNLSPDEAQLLEDYRDATEESRGEAAAMLHRSAERCRQDTGNANAG